MADRPHILCPHLGTVAPARWAGARRAFAAAPVLPLLQAWREFPEDGFQPGQIRVGWHEDALWVLAELADAAIVSLVNGVGEPAFLSGDVFEILVRPAGCEPYCEFHVTPGNGRMQLLYPDAASVVRVREGLTAGAADPFAPYKVAAELFQSWTRVEEQVQRWEVLARIPFASLLHGKGASAPACFDVSFCRYDYAPGVRTPVISSSSPHREADFHRQEEWAELELI